MRNKYFIPSILLIFILVIAILVNGCGGGGGSTGSVVSTSVTSQVNNNNTQSTENNNQVPQECSVALKVVWPTETTRNSDGTPQIIDIKPDETEALAVRTLDPNTALIKVWAWYDDGTGFKAHGHIDLAKKEGEETATAVMNGLLDVVTTFKAESYDSNGAVLQQGETTLKLKKGSDNQANIHFSDFGIMLSANPTEIAADCTATSEITAEFKYYKPGDEEGSPTGNPVSNKSIYFETNLGVFTESGSTEYGKGQLKTDGNGQAVCHIKSADENDGTATIYVYDEGDTRINKTCAVLFESLNNTLTLLATPSPVYITLSSTGSSTITATFIVDNNPVANKDIYFYLISGPAQSSLSATYTKTNAEGKAVVTLSSPVGTCQVKAGVLIDGQEKFSELVSIEFTNTQRNIPVQIIGAICTNGQVSWATIYPIFLWQTVPGATQYNCSYFCNGNPEGSSGWISGDLSSLEPEFGLANTKGKTLAGSWVSVQALQEYITYHTNRFSGWTAIVTAE